MGEGAGEAVACHCAIVEDSRLVRQNTHTPGRCEDRTRQVAPLRRGRLGHLEPSCGKLLEKRHCARVYPATSDGTILPACARAGGGPPFRVRRGSALTQAEFQCTYKKGVVSFHFVTLCLYLCPCARGHNRRSYLFLISIIIPFYLIVLQIFVNVH